MYDIVKQIHRFTKKVAIVETRRLAEEAGSNLTQNVVLLGALVAFRKLPIKEESVIEAMEELVATNHVKVNVKAFKLGCRSMKRSHRQAKSLSP
jgi:indolepyruvate ferredoxin oxidoreductase beta subunit